MSDPWDELQRPGPSSAEVAGVTIRRGSRVRLHPRAGGDIFDLALAGKLAAVESLEEDDEGRDLPGDVHHLHDRLHHPLVLHHLHDARVAHQLHPLLHQRLLDRAHLGTSIAGAFAGGRTDSLVDRLCRAP